MRHVLNRVLSVVVLAALALPAAAETAVHRGNRGEPDTLDPHKTANGWEASIAMELFSGLTAFGPAGEVLPSMAERWDVSEDGLTYTWHLRDGLTWSDGEAFTAGDFVYSFRRLFDPATASSFASLLYVIKGSQAVNAGDAPPDSLGVHAHDDRTLVMELEHPASYLPQILIHRGLPVPKHIVETMGPRWARPGTLVGNGAFTLAEWVPQSHVRLEPNPSFFAADSVAVDALYFHPAEDLSTAIDRFRAGELDIVPAVPRDRLAWARENMPESLRINPSLGVEFLVFNTNKPPFDDLRIRQALSMAVRRAVLAQRVLGGGERDAYSIVHPAVMGDLGAYVPPVLAGDTEERLARARGLLRAAGFDDGTPLTVSVRYNNQDVIKRTMEVIADMWSASLPVSVDLLGSDTPTLYADTRSGNFDVARAAWYPEMIDASTYLYLLKSTSGPMNQSGYNNPAYDALLDRADRETDPAKRLALFREAEVLLGNDQPVAPLFYYAFSMLVSPRVEGWADHNRNTHPGRFLSVKAD